jgi:hypothetical protein
MAEKYYNKKPPEFGMIEYSGGLIFVPDIPVFFLLNLLRLALYQLERSFRASGGKRMLLGKD